MLIALRIPDFRLLLTGALVSNLGSWLLVVAVPYHVYLLTGSIAATGLTLAVESLPALLVGPVAGVFVDRWDRRRLMVAADVLRAGAVALLLAADRPDRVDWLYAAVLAENLGAVFFRPAARARLPAVVGVGADLVGANALMGLVNGVIRLVGPPLGAVLLTGWGFPALVLLDAASYLVSAAAIAATSGHPGPAQERGGLAGRLRELRAGLGFAARHRTLRAVLATGTAFLTGNAVFTALLIPFVASRFGRDPGAVGYLLSALGVGYLLGAPLAARLVRAAPPRALLFAGQAGVAVCFAGLVNAPVLGVALVALGLSGVPGALLLITVETTVQRCTPDLLRGRVGAVFFAADAAAELVGALLGTALGASGRLSTVLDATAAAILAAAALGPLALPARRESRGG